MLRILTGIALFALIACADDEEAPGNFEPAPTDVGDVGADSMSVDCIPDLGGFFDAEFERPCIDPFDNETRGQCTWACMETACGDRWITIRFDPFTRELRDGAAVSEAFGCDEYRFTPTDPPEE